MNLLDFLERLPLKETNSISKSKQDSKIPGLIIQQRYLLYKSDKKSRKTPVIPFWVNGFQVGK